MIQIRHLRLLLLAAALLWAAPARAQFGPPGPPAVGVAKVEPHAITETSEFIGRIQAVDRVDLVARVSAFLVERLFTEGADVEKGQLLFRLERGPYEADVAAKEAAIAQNEALLKNAQATLSRVRSLMNSPAGRVSDVDSAVAQQASLEAQIRAGAAQLRASRINLDYTAISAPIAGKISRANFSIGNVVGPSSGALATLVSQDPMYVFFPISVRTALELRNRYADKGGFAAVLVRLRLSDGRAYGPTGTLDYVDPTVAANTDTVTLRARIANPLRAGAKTDEPGNHELLDGEFVTVLLEGVQPVMALGIPRTAVLQDQQGSYVYVVDAEKKVQVRRITLGQSSPTVAAVLTGLAEGELVVADGIQRVRPGIVVNPAPITPPPAAAAPAPKSN